MLTLVIRLPDIPIFKLLWDRIGSLALRAGLDIMEKMFSYLIAGLITGFIFGSGYASTHLVKASVTMKELCAVIIL